jgi:hypothetical protein
MSDIRRGVAPRPGWLRSCAAFITAGIALVFIQPVGHAQTDALSFFKNYFITGDYVVGGVGLRGLGGLSGVPGIARGTIAISGVPAKADIVAAFLYWQIVSKNTLGPDSGALGAKFEGLPLTSSSGPLAKVLVSDGTAPCWSSGGATGSANGQIRTYTYRADVLRFLPVDANGNFVVNGAHAVEIPDSGPSGNTVPIAIGASLVVVYRDPSLPLNAIVIYDGGYTMDNSTGSMTQTIRGFYQADGTAAKMTHIVGSGQANKSERLLLPGLAPIVNPFNASSGNNWDSPTYNVTLTSPNEPTTTSVDHVGFPSFDCLSWAAIILKVPVKDSDRDGLLDVWESATAPVTDPNGRPLPNLAAMGADKDHKDLFVEVGYMQAAEGTTYGGVAKPQHSHLPDEAALNAMGDVFKDNGINVHFDVGSNYQDSPYVIRADRARGGEAIDETVTSCSRGATDPPWVCQFSGYPGTVGWKTGFKFLRDQLVNTPPAVNADGSDPCDSPTADDGPGAACERRFDRNRQDIFHYVLFAHAVGLPKAACLNGDGTADDQCQATNPDFHVPRTNSGVADVPGGDLMVALGAFSDVSGKPVGTPFMQGATLMHELGHNFELTHAGIPQTPPEPNCKPNYMSVMNYLFQLRGLFNDLDAGVPHMDYSGEALGGIDESLPGDGFLFGASARYKSGWYAPQGPGTIGTPARGYCNGTAFPSAPPAPMVRVDAASVFGPIDWNLDPSLSSSQDLNLDGAISSPLNAGSNDWINLHLGQVGVRRNVGGLFVDGAGNLILGPMSLDVGRGDIGRGDIGRGDIGRGDIGRGDIGRGDIGRGDIGRGDIGRGDIGRGDIGEAAEEIDSTIAAAAGNTPPTQFTACVIGIGGCPGNTADPAQNHRVRTAWRPPNVGTVARYLVYRFRTDDPLQRKTQVGSVPATLGTSDYSLVDLQELENAQFTYFVVAEFGDGPPSTVSGPSNFFTVLVVNDAPVAVNDPNASGGSYTTNQDTPLAIAAPGVLGNDTDDDSPKLMAKLASGPANGTVTLNADGSFTYTPKVGFAGSDSFTYTANDVDTTRSSNVATVSIPVKSTQYTVILSQLKTPAQQGSAVPISWQLKDASGKLISSLSTLLKIESVFNGPAPANGPCVASASGTRETLFSLPNGATGSSSFRLVLSGYQFNWDTTTTSTAPTITGKGCYTALLYLNDRPDLTNPRMTSAVQLK